MGGKQSEVMYIIQYSVVCIHFTSTPQLAGSLKGRGAASSAITADLVMVCCE